MNDFKANDLSAAEQALQDWEILYTKDSKGCISVEGDLDIYDRDLTKLPDLTKVVVKGRFNCCYNLLTNLEGAPQEVWGGFYCANNQLTSLEGAPQEVWDDFYCEDNRLTSLEGLPKYFKELISDFGNFNNFEEVPENFLHSPENLARMKEEADKQERIEIDKKCKKAVVLQKPIKIKLPVKFK